jgi:methionyl aminopeptidase
MNDKLDSMRRAGEVNLGAIEHGFSFAHPGITTREIDAEMEGYIREHGCTPAFKGYQPDGYASPFPATVCISPNSVVVHGIPSDYVLEPGDLLTLDVGTEYNGWYVDAARTRVIPGAMNGLQKQRAYEANDLIDATEAILEAQLSVVKNNCTFLQMILAAEAAAAKYRVTIMPQWGGHSIGEKVHLPPFIPSAIHRNTSKIKQQIEEKQFARQILTTGQTICIEPVVTLGSNDIMIDEDGWTIRQTQHHLTAHTERCLLVTEHGYELLS